MKKPIFRWTIGNVSKLGYECLETSIKTMIGLYNYEFEYYICCNNINIQIIREIVGSRSIKIIQQTWNDCPLPIDYKNNFNTSLWKFCPARMDIDRHEIVSDNDVVLIKKLPEIEQFLCDSKILLVEDPIKYQGNFRHLFENNEKYNAGFVGFPPKYDLESALMTTWQENQCPKVINQADEQGLTTATLKKENFIKISKDHLVLIHSKGRTLYFGYDEKTNKNQFDCETVNFVNFNASGYHFVGANKNNHHEHWNLFKLYLKSNNIKKLML